MVIKVKAYGKQGRDNVALQLGRLHIDSPSKGVQLDERQPLQSVDGNIQKSPEKPKGKGNKKHRKSLLFDRSDDIKAVDIDSQTKKHLHPLTLSAEVSTAVLDFAGWSEVWTKHCNFVKIAHGTYGAVFRIESKAEPGTFTIGKLIPLQAPSGLGSKTKEFTSPEAASNEILLLSKLDELAGFVQFRKAEVVQGILPAALKAASAAFDITKDDISAWWTRACSNTNQLWLFLEMSDAGTDLETVLDGSLQDESSLAHLEQLTAVQIRDIFWQVASALGLAEQRFQFEHRDLHLGNICLKVPEHPVGDGGLALRTGDPSILVTIIDYTLSRASVPSDIFPTYNDLSKDPALFEGSGARQYDMYRDMKAILKDHWYRYRPRTNVLWLRYLLEMLLEKKSEEYLNSADLILWNDLADMKRWLMRSDGKQEAFDARDVVRYCENGGPKRTK